MPETKMPEKTISEKTKVTICRTETVFRYVDIEIPYDKDFKVRACDVAAMLPITEFERPTENVLHRVVCWTAPSSAPPPAPAQSPAPGPNSSRS